MAWMLGNIRMRKIFLAICILIVISSLLILAHLGTVHLQASSLLPKLGSLLTRPIDGPSEDDISRFLTKEQHDASRSNMRIVHHEIHSNLTSTGRWFYVDFLTQQAFNPSILPHPSKPSTYIVIAQRDKRKDSNILWNAELYCEATFISGEDVLRCTNSPLILPIASTGQSARCDAFNAHMNNQLGPHDARIFWGLDAPYVIYGSQAKASCLGQWVQDLRRVVDWGSNEQQTNQSTTRFFWPTNLQRPQPAGRLEKNWFLFWDREGDIYVHYDIQQETRSFAKIEDPNDGSISEDLAPLAQDAKCLKKLMPKLKRTGFEWIHQATNSLAITLCDRADVACQETHGAENTYIMVLFQKKTFYNHGVYEPYIMLFQQSSPFQVHGISSKPLWYYGRGRADEDWRRPGNEWKPKDQSEMVFTMSMNFKQPGVGYHGYLDDEVIISFGIEDQHAGGMDVVVRELLKEMAYCK